MDHFAGLDVSVKDTSVCIVDDTGKIVREVKMASEPEALLAALSNPAYHLKRIGLEAGPLAQWLFSALAEAASPVICVETRHMRAVLQAQINKTDRNDARGIAQMMRVGLYRPVHVKTLRSQKLRMLLTRSQATAVKGHRHRERFAWYFTQLRPQGREGSARRSLRPVSRSLSRTSPTWLSWSNHCSLSGGCYAEQIVILHRRLLAIVRDDEVCRRPMSTTTPGVGPVVALTYRATVDVPARFRKSKAVGAVFGLTCSKYRIRRDRSERQNITLRR